MPRAKPLNTPVANPGDTSDDSQPDGVNDLPPTVDDTGDEEELVNDVERVCAEVGSTTDAATINVFRVDESRKNPDAFLMSTTPKEFSLERILFEYGGGRYRIRGYHPREYGGVKFFVNRVVVLEEPKRKINEAPSSNLASTEIIGAINEMNRQNQEILKTLLLAQGKPQESRETFIREMVAMKELFSPQQAPEPQQNPLGMLKDMMELQQSIKLMNGDGEGGGGGTMGILGMKLLDKLGELANASKSQQHSLPHQSVMPSPPPVPAGLRTNPVISPMVSDEQKQEREMLDAIIAAASANADTGFWADAIYDQAPDELLDAVLNDPDWFDKFKAMDARLPVLKPWFVRVAAKVAEIDKAENASQNDDTAKTSATDVPKASPGQPDIPGGNSRGAGGSVTDIKANVEAG